MEEKETKKLFVDIHKFHIFRAWSVLISAKVNPEIKFWVWKRSLCTNHKNKTHSALLYNETKSKRSKKWKPNNFMLANGEKVNLSQLVELLSESPSEKVSA